MTLIQGDKVPLDRFFSVHGCHHSEPEFVSIRDSGAWCFFYFYVLYQMVMYIVAVGFTQPVVVFK